MARLLRSPRALWLLVPLLAGLLLLGGCGGIFYGEMGDWEPGQVRALPPPVNQAPARPA
jgi:hypothetical protein